MAKIFEIIYGPVITEKSTFLREVANQYVFEINPKANRIEVKKEVERVFPKVKVLDVKTLNIRGKVRRVGASIGKRSNWKKAIVKVRPGDSIEFFEGA